MTAHTMKCFRFSMMMNNVVAYKRDFLKDLKSKMLRLHCRKDAVLLTYFVWEIFAALGLRVALFAFELFLTHWLSPTDLVVG